MDLDSRDSCESKSQESSEDEYHAGQSSFFYLPPTPLQRRERPYVDIVFGRLVCGGVLPPVKVLPGVRYVLLFTLEQRSPV